MSSLHNYRTGFTAVEVLVIMGMLALVGGFSLIVSLDSYRGSSFRSDRTIFIAVLQRARAQAMSNICNGTCTDGAAHGVKVSGKSLVLFQGSSYASRDTDWDTEFSMNLAEASGDDEIVFAPLSGNASYATTTLADSMGHVSTTTISSAGQITWTN
jgi:Tfp pilus assembly protein FimT